MKEKHSAFITWPLLTKQYVFVEFLLVMMDNYEFLGQIGKNYEERQR